MKRKQHKYIIHQCVLIYCPKHNVEVVIHFFYACIFMLRH